MKSTFKSKINALQPLLLPVLLLAVSLVLLNSVHGQAPPRIFGYAVTGWKVQAVQVLGAAAAVFFLCRLIDVAFWNRLATRRGRPVPTLLKDFVAILFENHPQVFSNQGMIVDHQNLALHQGCPFHGVCENPG